MKLAVVANVLQSEEAGQTTHRLAAECARRGHDVWVLSPGAFTYNADDRLLGRARPVPAGPRRPAASLDDRDVKWVTVDELDLMLLRNNPSVQHAWAQTAAISFGRLAMRRGVIVLNDPNGLAKAANKLYLQTFPEEVRPRTLISRDDARLKRFARDEATIVIKPLSGSGGQSVFVVRPNDQPNLDEMIRAVSRDGYVIAQEYLPKAAEGDTRLFLMNGAPLRCKGRYAAFRRVRTGGDLRSNVHAGGRIRRAVVDDAMLGLAEMVRPRLVEDGMFLVGLDIVGDKLMEVNVFSPGGLGNAQRLEKVDFVGAVADALERKVEYMSYYRRNFENVEMATL